MAVTKKYLTNNDFNTICRTCLSSKNLQIISGVLNDDLIPIEFVLNKHTQIEVDSTDHLPKQICSDCVRNLYSAYTFLNNCELVNKALIECSMRYKSNLNTLCEKKNGNYLPHAIELVRCEIKDEPLELIPSEDSQNENFQDFTSFKSESFCTPVDLKVESQPEYFKEICMKNNDENIQEQTDQRFFENESKYGKVVIENVDSSEIVFDCSSKSNKTNGKKTENNVLIRSTDDQKLMTKPALIYHLNTHEEEKSRCCICLKEFCTCMKNHKCKKCKKIIELESFHKCGAIRKYKCSQCRLTFTNKSLLFEHKKSGHKKSVQERDVQCKMCGEKFQYFSHLKHHFKLHSKNRSYSCNLCDKTFCFETVLKKHKKTHEITYACDKCPTVFTDFETLNQHKLNHPGYVRCNICSVVLKGTALGNHKRVHNKFYRCNVCMEDFSTESKLSTHRTARCLLLKACFCLECGEKFPSSDFLKQHMLIHDAEPASSADLVKKCRICNMRFTNVEDFQDHLFDHYRYYLALYNISKQSVT